MKNKYRKSILTRADDCGSGKGANRAVKEAADAGFVKNISLMACGQWISESAEALKDRRDICFGMHFTMHSEWDRVKFAPVSSKEQIPLLLNPQGDFYAAPSDLASSLGQSDGKREENMGAERLAELICQIRREWNGQLDKLARLGFFISYADTHMFPERAIPGLKEAMRQWIREKGLIDHQYFYHPIPRLDELSKQEGLFETVLRNLEDGQYFYLSHPAYPSEDMYLTGNRQVPAELLVKSRQADYQFVTAEETIALCEKWGVVPIRYDEAKEGSYDSAEEWLGVRSDYTVEKIDTDTWRITDAFQDYMYLVQGDRQAALIDTGMGLPGLAGLVRSLTDKPVIVLHTHGHLDHVGCSHEFDMAYLHPRDLEVLKRHRGKEYRDKIRNLAEEAGLSFPADKLYAMIDPPAMKETRALSGGQRIDLGNRELLVIETPGHTTGSVCFLDRRKKQLFSGDTVCAKGVMLSFPCSAPAEEFMASIKNLKGYAGDIEKIYPGHHEVPIDISYLDRYLECGQRLLQHPGDGIREESVFGEIFRFFYKDVSITYQ